MGSTASRCFSRAYRLIDAAQVVQILSSVGDIQPTSERQIRSLTKLEPEEQREAWKIATAITLKPTAALVEREGDFSNTEAPVREMDELNRRLTEHLAKTDSSLTSNF
jgi:hypothetical protein